STFSRCLCTSQGHTGKVTSVSLSADGSLAVSGSDGQNITLSTGVPTVALWETTTGSCLGTLHEGHIDLVTSVSLSADGRFAASGSSDQTVRLWETTTGRYLHTLRGHTDRVTSVGLSADGRFAVSGSRDQTVRLWETTTGRCLHTLRDHIGL